MKRDEAVRTDLDIKQYLEKNKIRAMFSQFTKELLLKKPDDPVSYLINYLEKRTKRQIVCLHSYDNQARMRLANIAANKFNFKLIELSSLYKDVDYHQLDNAEINKKVQGQLNSTESVYKGIIISGYPNNLVQLDFIQKCTNPPDRYFILPSDQAKVKTSCSKMYSQKQTELVLERNRLQIKQLKQNLGESLEKLSENPEKASDKLVATLSIKAKKQIPYDSLRILAVHPPYLAPQTTCNLIDKYSLHSINIESCLQKLSEKKKFNQFVEKHVRRNGYISKQIQLAILETQCRSAPARNKGYMISGWPKRKESLSFLKETFLNPHIIFVFDMDDKSAEQNFNQLDQRNHKIFAVSQKPSVEDFKKQLIEYRKVVEELKKKQRTQVIVWKQSDKQVQKAFESLIENQKIYS